MTWHQLQFDVLLEFAEHAERGPHHESEWRYQAAREEQHRVIARPNNARAYKRLRADPERLERKRAATRAWRERQPPDPRRAMKAALRAAREQRRERRKRLAQRSTICVS